MSDDSDDRLQTPFFGFFADLFSFCRFHRHTDIPNSYTLLNSYTFVV